MLTWGFVVWIAIWLILRDMHPVTKAKLMGQPMLMHVLVMGSGLWIHGGSAQGAMAAVLSGVISGLYVSYNRKMYGYIKNKRWFPGINRQLDPRGAKA